MAHGDAAPGTDHDVLERRERTIVCASCSSVLTSRAARIAMNGAHEHEFMNPAALRFVVRCFAAAPGCAGDGERSTTWTWFPGFAWEIALCRACGVHLGWSFHGASTFHGLIRDRIRES